MRQIRLKFSANFKVKKMTSFLETINDSVVICVENMCGLCGTWPISSQLTLVINYLFLVILAVAMNCFHLRFTIILLDSCAENFH